MKHEVLEKNVGLMAVLIVIVIAIGGLVEIIPLMFQAQTVTAAPGVKPYSPLRLAGRDIYIREGCVGCHSQMIRTLASETQRYGPYTLAGETVYDRPFLWGSKRTGPDLSRVGGRYSDDWHRVHLLNPRNVVPESNMPGYPVLTQALVDPKLVETKMRTLKWMGHPYTEADFASINESVVGKTELDAVVAYLQGLGVKSDVGAEETQP